MCVYFVCSICIKVCAYSLCACMYFEHFMCIQVCAACIKMLHVLGVYYCAFSVFVQVCVNSVGLQVCKWVLGVSHNAQQWSSNILLNMEASRKCFQIMYGCKNITTRYRNCCNTIATLSSTATINPPYSVFRIASSGEHFKKYDVHKSKKHFMLGFFFLCRNIFSLSRWKAKTAKR